MPFAGRFDHAMLSSLPESDGLKVADEPVERAVKDRASAETRFSDSRVIRPLGETPSWERFGWKERSRERRLSGLDRKELGDGEGNG